MEFKVGDTVKILNRVGGEHDYSPIYTDGMLQYAGTLTTIKAIADTHSLALSNNPFYWDKKAVKLISEDKYIHPSELKDGDFIKIWDNSDYNFIYIFKEYKDNHIYRHASVNLKSNRLNINPDLHWNCSDLSTKITYATEEEKNLLNEVLLKEGYIWDNVAKQLQTIGTININNSTGVVAIPEEYCVSDDISRVNPVHIPSHPKYSVFVDTYKEESKEELNLFPTKRHYQLNFNY